MKVIIIIIIIINYFTLWYTYITIQPQSITLIVTSSLLSSSLLPTNPLFLCPNPFHILLIPQTRKSLQSPSCFGLLELIKITINNHKLPYNNTYASAQTRSITDRNQLIERSPDLNNGQQFFNGLRVSVVMERCHCNAGIE